MFFLFSESALKNVKTLKQRSSELKNSGTSTREAIVDEFSEIIDPWGNSYYMSLPNDGETYLSKRK